MAFVAMKYAKMLIILSILKTSFSEEIDRTSLIENVSEKSDTDLKSEASGRIFDTRYNIPASVYGAPGGGYNPGNNYNTGFGYSGITSPGYNGYNGYNGYSGYSGYNGLTGSGYNNIGTPYYGSGGYGGYAGNGGYGGYGGNGGFTSYSGYNYPYYSGQQNLGYGYYRGGLGSPIYRNRFGATGYGGVTPSYVSGYRGYTK